MLGGFQVISNLYFLHSIFQVKYEAEKGVDRPLGENKLFYVFAYGFCIELVLYKKKEMDRIRKTEEEGKLLEG